MMTREDIIRIAEMAGFDEFFSHDLMIEKFARMIIAAERKACAKVADEHWVFGMSSSYIADAIRARGDI